MTPVRARARIAGLLYLIIIATALFSEMFVRSQLVVSDDAAATAANILASEQLFRSAGVAGLVTLICDIAIAALFFEIFRPAGATLSLMAASFRIAFSAIMGVIALFHFIPLVLLGDAPYLSDFSAKQLQELAYLSLKLHSAGFNIALVFFGAHCLLIGVLIVKSGIAPRLIGILMAIAGASYALNSFARFAAPEFADTLFPLILLPPLIGEASLTLWLIIFGADDRRWLAMDSKAKSA